MAIDKNINLKELGYYQLTDLGQNLGQLIGEGRRDLILLSKKVEKEIALRDYLSKFTNEEIIKMGYEEYLN